MKWLSFIAREGRPSYGVLDGDSVLDLGALRGAAPDLKTALARGELQANAGAERRRLQDLVLLPPIPNPGKILCVGHNYEEHRKETGRAKADFPSIFTRFADTLIAHEAPLLLPRASSQLDFEGELAVVIGSGGRAIAEADAFEHVAGYACFNDASLRDWQWHTTQFIPGKNFPGTGAFGPFLVSRDEVEPSSLRVTTRLNGNVMQDQPVSEMLFPIPKLIAYISRFTPLSPGDVIATGTPGGVGAKRQPPVWMKAGDRVEVSIGPVGTLSNVVAAEVE